MHEVEVKCRAAGLITDLLRRWYGPEYCSQRYVVAEADRICYGLAVLRTGLVSRSHYRRPGRHRRGGSQTALESALCPSPPTTTRLRLLAGIFAREGERDVRRYPSPEPALERLQCTRPRQALREVHQARAMGAAKLGSSWPPPATRCTPPGTEVATLRGILVARIPVLLQNPAGVSDLGMREIRRRTMSRDLGSRSECQLPMCHTLL